MSEKPTKPSREIYEFDSLTEYSWRERLSIHLIARTFYTLIRLIGKTIRFEIKDWENFESIERDGKVPVYAFWHDRIFLTTYYFRNRGIVVMSSQSFDGEYIARFIKRFGYGTVRGSSTRGAVAALARMIRLMKENLPMGFSVDGPKGPKHFAKPGALLLAKKTGNPVMPFLVEAEKNWTIKSWDRLQIPKPFARALVVIAEPIYISKEADDREIENKREELQAKLDELVAVGKQWRESITK